MIWCPSFPVGASVRPSSSSVARLCQVEIGLRECLDPSETILGDLFKPQKQRGDHRLGEFAPLQCGGDPMQASNSIGKLQVEAVGGSENCGNFSLWTQPICAFTFFDQRYRTEIQPFGPAIHSSVC